jgi:hypothetical protein
MTAMRGRVLWSLSVPLAAMGSLAGHQFGYALAVPDPHERAHLLERSGHAYLEYAPLAIAVFVALLAVGFVAAAGRVLGRRPSRGAPAYLAGALGPLTFLIQEHIERFLHHHQAQWDTILQPAVLLGLVLQAPFALLAMTLAGWLGRLAVRLGETLRAAPPRLILAQAVPRLATVDLPRRAVLARGYAERGPPVHR